MLYLPIYHQQSQLYKLGFLSQGDNDLTVVAPSPDSADAIRAKLSKIYTEVKCDVLTISKFAKNEIAFYFQEDSSFNIKRKAELKLLFSSICIKFFPDITYETFESAFKTITELRSYTLDDVLLKSLLEEFEPNLTAPVLMFNQLLTQLGYLDEHSAFAELANKVRAIPLDEYHEKKRNIIFLDFQNISSQQIDFIKSLSIRDDVYIPVPYEANLKSTKADWLGWLKDALAKEYVIDPEAQENKIKINMTTFSKGSLGKILLDEVKPGNQIILCQNKNQMSHIFEIPFADASFRTSHETLEDEINKRFRVIEKKYLQNADRAEVEVLVDDFKAEIKSFKAGDDYRTLKALFLYLDVVTQWQELSSDNIVFSLKELKIFKDVVKLNAPKNFINKIVDKSQILVSNLSSFLAPEEYQHNYLCLTSEYSAVAVGEQVLSNELESKLMVVGPIRKSEFENALIKSKILELLKNKNISFFIEQGIIQHEQFWNEFVESCEIALHNKAVSEQAPYRGDFLKEQTKHFIPMNSISASKIQGYLDCPRKFYFSYIEQLNPDIKLETQMLPNQLGTLEHRVVEVYFSMSKSWDTELHKKVLKQEFERFVRENKLSIPLNTRKIYEIELRNYTENAIKFLGGILLSDPQLVFNFEKKFMTKEDGVNKVGSIDFWAESPERCLIVDMKRGGFSIPNKSEVLHFDKIQLWFYLNVLNNQEIEQKEVQIGFFNMSDPEESIFFANTEMMLNPDSKIKTYHLENFSNLFSDYKDFEKTIIAQIQNEKSFAPAPRKSTTCDFCDLRNLCPRQMEGVYV
ncbi:MAG: PD-(D/E)XK nuclease family protein [Bacteriovoracaceae bacterium]|nr:PD-(D/E)XK nuclease family protein [Bacteriovoracaceae bacterium]